MDRTLLTAFCISLGLHLIVLGIQLVNLPWPSQLSNPQMLNVVYEYQAAEQELRRLQHQLTEFGEPHKLAELSPGSDTAPSMSGGGAGGMSGSLSFGQIRIPDRPAVGLSGPLPGNSTTRSAVVDLTNLVEAAQGDPVLLSYFSALREQIQRTANQRTWLTSEEGDEGLVYVTFVLAASGRVNSVTVLSDRSAPSRALQDVSVKIVKSAGPFAPFPPSIAEPTKTVVVPLEFVRGS